MTTISKVVALSTAVILIGCQSSRGPAAADDAGILAADSAWAESFAKKDISAYMSFVDSAASVQRPNATTVTGPAAIRDLVQSYFALPGIAGTWHPVTAKAALSNDLAYSTGTYEISYDSPSKERLTERGKYTYVWRKASDGKWKMLVESFSSDTPPAAPASK